MGYNFQFAFLGCQNNYLARLTRVNVDGYPQEDSITETYGLSNAFASQFSTPSYKKRFIYNIRGHDFLSYSGQWKGRLKVGHVETAFVPVSESSVLESLSRENREKGFLGVDMTASLGPWPGSIFVDAYALKRYKRANLPVDLEDNIQRILDVKGYGDGEIDDVVMNALGGWVMLLDGRKKFAFGGKLPFDLSVILEDTQESKRQMPRLDISIYRIYLNHQNPQEYVLIFEDGRCFISLHAKFRDPIERLLKIWATKNGHKKFHVTFNPSSGCTEDCQKALNASYYSRRGLFFLSRRNVDMAIKYLREASYQDNTSKQIRDSYYLAITGMRRAKADPILEALIRDRTIGVRKYRLPLHRPEHHEEAGFFRDEYMWMLDDEHVDVAELERQLDELEHPFLDGKWKLFAGGALSEWSYDMAITGNKPHELDDKCSVLRGGSESGPYEVDAGGVVSRVDSQLSELSSTREVGDGANIEGAQKRRIHLNAPTEAKQKSRYPLNRLKIWKG